MAKKEAETEVVEEVPLTKKELKAQKKAEKKKKRKEKTTGFWKDFKKFAARGNIIDMSIGVVIGGAFSAIVTALTNIFLSICTWAVPGGLKGLVTVLPPLSDGQYGLEGAGQSFASSNLEAVVAEVAKLLEKTPDAARTEIMSKYTLHGSIYVFNGAAMIDWGAFINAALSFFVIAMVLFLILRGITKLNKARQMAYEKALEEHYKKHPEDRPAPVDPKAPEPTDHQLLKEILAALKANNGETNKSKKPTKKK